MRKTVLILTLALVGFLVIASPAPAIAHERVGIGGHEIVVGWLEEPAYAGFKNAVQFVATHKDDGDPVRGAKLQVEVIFGDRDGEEKMGPMDLGAAFGSPGEYHAFLVPTRPGTYTFHITGSLGEGEPIDRFFTSGEQTFADIEDLAAVQFPANDPTAGQLSEKIDRVNGRLASVKQAADSAARSASDAADSARLMAIVGIALGGVALSVAIVVLLVLRPRRSTA
ncbi:MAG: hypothetical protein ACRDHO_13010 [Actinomycetota bacterium]